MRMLFCVFAAVALTSCQSETAPPKNLALYKISEDGAPTVSNMHEYEGLGDRTFTKTQKYKIIAAKDEGRDFHVLAVNIVMKVGNKKVESQEGAFLPIADGVYTFECIHQYDIKLNVPMDTVENPTCDFTPIGVMTLDAPASFEKTS